MYSVDNAAEDGFASSPVSFSKWHGFWIALLVASVPMLIPYFADMWAKPHYQYFPFVFVAVGVLIYQRSNRQFYPPRGWIGWTLLGLGFSLLLMSIIAQAVWLGGVGFVFLAMSFVASLRGDNDSSLIALAIPVAMLISLPLDLDSLLIQWLQNLTTSLSSVSLDLWGVAHGTDGNVLRLPGRELFVADACSGIQSVFTLTFLSSLIMAFMRRRLWLAPFYLVAAIVLAVFGNVIRVTAVAVAQSAFEVDLAEGWQHELLGYTTLGVAGLLLLSFDRLVITLLHPVELISDGMLDNPLVKSWNFLVSDRNPITAREAYSSFKTSTERVPTDYLPSWLDRVLNTRGVTYGFLATVAILVIGSLVQLGRMQSGAPVRTIYSSNALFAPADTLFDGQCKTFEFSNHKVARDGSDPRLGENADLWDVRFGNLAGQVVLSQPYSGWHELCVCYQNLDWTLKDRDVISDVEIKVAPQSEQDESFVTAQFTSDDGQQGYLMFSAISYDGTIPDAPNSFGAFGTRFMGRLDRSGIIDRTDIMMFQIWFPTTRTIEPKVLRAIQKDYVRARSVVAKSIMQEKSNVTNASTAETQPSTDNDQT